MHANPIIRLLLQQYRRCGGAPLRGAAPPADRLHLGCGHNPLPGWLNTDYAPTRPDIAPLDAARPFPYADGSFRCIYSEHMIEHIPYPSGVLMLAECFRTLAPGGRLRIATPDLNFLVELCRDPEKPLHRDYIRWANAHFFPDATADAAVFVVNNFVRCWGHVFIYDAGALQSALESIGYVGVRRVPLDASDRPELAGLANAGRMPPGFLELETMVFEADRPAAPAPDWLAALPRHAGAPAPAAAPAGAGLRRLYHALRPLPLIGPLLERLKRSLRG